MVSARGGFWHEWFRAESTYYYYFQQVTGIIPIANTGSPLWYNIEHNDIEVLCTYYIVIINILLRMSVHNRVDDRNRTGTYFSRAKA